MSSNADAPREQLNSIEKLMEYIKKMGENEALEQDKRERLEVSCKPAGDQLRRNMASVAAV